MYSDNIPRFMYAGLLASAGRAGALVISIKRKYVLAEYGCNFLSCDVTSGLTICSSKLAGCLGRNQKKKKKKGMTPKL